ncbi:unnamed protein product [Urochloa humidicola]
MRPVLDGGELPEHVAARRHHRLRSVEEGPRARGAGASRAGGWQVTPPSTSWRANGSRTHGRRDPTRYRLANATHLTLRYLRCISSVVYSLLSSSGSCCSLTVALHLKQLLPGGAGAGGRSVTQSAQIGMACWCFTMLELSGSLLKNKERKRASPLRSRICSAASLLALVG